MWIGENLRNSRKYKFDIVLLHFSLFLYCTESDMKGSQTQYEQDTWQSTQYTGGLSWLTENLVQIHTSEFDMYSCFQSALL